MENDSVCRFAFIGKIRFAVAQNVLVSVILEFELLKYCFLHVLEFLHFVPLFFCNFASLHLREIY